MTEREKIIKVIDEWANKAVKANKFDGASVYNSHNAAELADALIAAGIGDVSELKKHRVIVEQSPVPTDDNCYILPNTSPIIKQLYSGKEVEQIAKERDEYKHRAERAERALRDELVQKTIRLGVTDICPWYIQALNEAEKELAEERKDD